MLLEPGVQVSAATAKQDKIEITYGDWVLQGGEEAFNSITNDIAYTQWEDLNSNFPAHARIFNEPPTWASKRQIKLREAQRNGRVQYAAPLLSGVFEVEHKEAECQIRIRAKLSINPTRAAHYQPSNLELLRAYRAGNHDPSLIGLVNLWTTPQPEYRVATPINPNHDNVLIDLKDRILGNPRYWNDFLSIYMISCGAFVRAVAHRPQQEARYHRQTPPEIEFENKQKITAAETYWEFTHHDPIRLARNLEPDIRAMGRQTQAREYRNVGSDGRTVSHAPSFTIGLGSTHSAAIYPKTNRALRLEIRHKIGKIRGITTSFSTDAEAVEKVLSLNEIATTQANTLLSALTEGMDYPEPAPAYELVAKILTACNKWPEVDQTYILSALINERGFICGFGDRARPVIQELIGQGVVRRIRARSQTYILTGRYRAAATLLASNLSAYVGDQGAETEL